MGYVAGEIVSNSLVECYVFWSQRRTVSSYQFTSVFGTEERTST